MKRLMLLLAGVALLGAACSKSDKPSGDAKTSPLTELVNKAAAADSATTLAPLLEARGFRIVSIRRVPAQLSGRRATAAVYRSADGARGGVLYMQRKTDEEGVTWHWYFADAAPDSLQALEINGDGLWDVRVFMSGGTTRDFIQGETFTLMTEREARYAMNGASSAGESWKALDGDTATVWQAPGGAFLEIPIPMGAGAGELSVRSGAGNIELFAGDKKVQDVALQGLNEFQLVRLAPELLQAPAIRVVVEGSSPTVAISEMEIR